MAKSEQTARAELDYRALFEAIPSACVVLRPDMTVVAVNDAYLHATLTRREELLGRMLFEVFPDNPAEAAIGGVRQVRESLLRALHRKTGDAIGVLRYDIPVGDGQYAERYWAAVNVPVLDDQGKVAFLIHRAEDVTDFVQDQRSPTPPEGLLEPDLQTLEVQLANQRLRAANAALEQERDMREQFVLTLSHDLRTPLAAARVATQLLFRKLDDALGAAKLIARVVTNIDRADQMIQDLLDANSLRAGKPLPLTIVDCELTGVVQEVLEELATLHGNRFVLHACKAIRGYWCCKELSRLLENLCVNGIKHGAPDQPVTVTLAREGDWVSIDVHNEGPPIPEQEQASLFEPFHRSQATPGRKGWGLGLTLVKGIAEAHGGHVEVQSSEASGTHFRVHLPIDARR